jgi:hypothetical protein
MTRERSPDAATVSAFLSDVLNAITERSSSESHVDTSRNAEENSQLLTLLPALNDASAANAILAAILQRESEADCLVTSTRGLDGLVAVVERYGWTDLQGAFGCLQSVREGHRLVLVLLYLLENLNPSLPARAALREWAATQTMPSGLTSEDRCQSIELALALGNASLLRRSIADVAGPNSDLQVVFKRLQTLFEGERQQACECACLAVCSFCAHVAAACLADSQKHLHSDRRMLLDGILAVAKDSSVDFSPDAFRTVMKHLIARNGKPEEVDRKHSSILCFAFCHKHARAHALFASCQLRRRALTVPTASRCGAS